MGLPDKFILILTMLHSQGWTTEKEIQLEHSNVHAQDANPGRRCANVLRFPERYLSSVPAKLSNLDRSYLLRTDTRLRNLDDNQSISAAILTKAHTERGSVA